MVETNKSLRIKTNINDTNPSLFVDLNQSYDTFEILSLKLKQEDIYKLHSANYGVIVGRVLANGNFGVPNAKISIFIEGNFENEEIASIYPYTSTDSQDRNGIRYNLLPEEKVDDCHQVVGTFPNKTYLLDNDVLIEVFDTYYKYTTRTNNSGDYIIAGVPTGNQTLHMDLDLSDCGILSQRPRDFVYKGYTIEQFENANQFKTDTNLDSLSQIFSQDQVVNVIPFWGNENQGETIGITRADINISFKFEPTCVFMGSVVADNSSNGISKKCVPTNQMGAMDELTTGEGTIEMIRYTTGGTIEEFQIKGTQLIDGNGVWCYQIPMNLDYMMTDEYGNMVPTDDPEKGIPTRTRVRFRVSMQDMEKNTDNYFRAKVLVPHNPMDIEGTEGEHEDYDYEFGSDTREDSFRDLLWNNVYTVKSYIPRFQKSKTYRETARFTGIKHCNYYGQNNPMPYNNIRIKLPLMFTILCALIKSYVRIVNIINNIYNAIAKVFKGFLDGIETVLIVVVSVLTLGMNFLIALFSGGSIDLNKEIRKISSIAMRWLRNVRYVTIADGLCPDLDTWYFAPVNENFTEGEDDLEINFLQQTFDYLKNKDSEDRIGDTKSIDTINSDDGSDERVCITINTDYLIPCIEMALAQEYRVINFDFYNDWVNGVIYMPRWMRYVRPKMTFLFGLIKIKSKIKACMDDTSIFNKTRYYVQQCSLSYKKKNHMYNMIASDNGCVGPRSKKQKCHKRNGKTKYGIFGGSKTNKIKGNGGVVHEEETSRKQYVYYMKPCEWRRQDNNKKVNLFATDIVLLGSLLDCNLYGIPQAFKYLTSSSYIMPTNLALTNMDDEGYLYADDNGTICSGVKEPDVNRTVEQVDNSYSGLSNYYSTAEETLQYGRIEGDTLADVYDDSIALTEAAGIAWNYTGPGQGEASNDVSRSIYMPGGHFLGISCVNSQTNIKSCVNLERICEIGSNMSQRREEVRKIVGKTNELQYNYFVPTGLISNNEINGGNFRSMFATMNQKRLLCTDKYDEKTGYPIYDFVYLRTNGFDGSLNKQTKTSEWNTKLSIKDESSELSKASGSQISKDVGYDRNETAYTYTRTLEEVKQDYYKFRLGINDLSNDEEQLKKFLLVDGLTVRLPQYNNSFYFYFGLKDGATAFDEFNKQFFSVCDTSSRFKKKMKVNMIKETVDMCNFTSDISFEGMNAVGLIKGKYEYYKDCEEDVTIVELPNNQEVGGNFVYSDTILKNLPFGVYTFTFTDDSGDSVIKTVELGKNRIKSSISVNNFEFRTTNKDKCTIVSNARQLNCGYISMDLVACYDGTENKMKVLDWNIYKDKLILVDVSTGDYFGKGEILPDCLIQSEESNRGSKVNCSVLGDDGKLYVWKSDTTYNIYLTSMENNCNGYTLLGSVFVEGIDNYDLFLGSKLLPYSTELVNYNGEWWRTIGDDTSNIKNWAKRYALYNRNDYDGEYFTNKVFAINVKNRILDTALFGSPENNNNYLSEVFYENDNYNERYPNYSLSDESILPTTLSISSTATKKPLFGEMAINGNLIVSDKIGTYDLFERDFHLGGTRNYFTCNMSNSKVLNKNGCLAKLEDGRILYTVKDGNKFYFNDEFPDFEEGVPIKISFYPIFYYPVIYRPFYAKAYFVDYVVPTVVQDDVGNLNVGFSGLTFMSSFEIHNGLTYKRRFGKVLISCGETEFDDLNNFERSLIKDDATGTEYGEVSNDVVELVHLYPKNGKEPKVVGFDNTYLYEINENGPDDTQTDYDKLIEPYKIELNTIEDQTSVLFTNRFNFRIINEENIRFYIEGEYKSSNNVDYFLVKESNVKPLLENGYVYMKNEEKNKLYHLVCTFGVESDKKLGAKYEDGEGNNNFVNKPGTLTYIDVHSDKLIIRYKRTNKSSDYVSKEIPIWFERWGKNYIDNLINGEDNIKEMLSEFDITPLTAYKLNEDKKAIDWYKYINEINENMKTFIFDENVPVYIGDEFGIQIKNGKWENINDYFIVAIQKFNPNQQRDEKQYEKAVNGKGSTSIMRFYKGFTQLESYNGTDEHFLKIEPEGENGIYTP